MSRKTCRINTLSLNITSEKYIEKESKCMKETAVTFYRINYMQPVHSVVIFVYLHRFFWGVAITVAIALCKKKRKTVSNPTFVKETL